MRTCERGQALLETTVVLGALFVAIAIGAGAVLAMTGNEHPSQARLIALAAVADATTELLAATAYDPSAPARVVSTQWTSGTTTISSQARSAGQARIVDLHYAAPGATGDISVTLRAATLPPGAVVDAAAIASLAP